MHSRLDSIGASLLQHSETATFSAAGALDRLFPFIYQASERMSSRAIAAWLAKEHNVQLGYTSISRALRHKEKRLHDFAEEIAMEAAAVAGEAWLSVEQVLSDEDQFGLAKSDFAAAGAKVTTDGGMAHFGRVSRAFDQLGSRWWALSPGLRAEVMNLINRHRGQDGEEEAHDAFGEQNENKEDRP